MSEKNSNAFENAPQLNESQYRKISSVLASFEVDLVRIARLLDGDGYTGAVFKLVIDIDLEDRDSIRKRIGTLREIIRMTAERFDLETHAKSSSRQISGILSSCWVSVEECTSSRLQGYGQVADGVAGTLDPELEQMINLMWEIEDLIHKKEI